MTISDKDCGDPATAARLLGDEKKIRMSITVPAWIVQAVADLAVDQGRSSSNVISRILGDALREYSNPDNLVPVAVLKPKAKPKRKSRKKPLPNPL